MGMRAGAHYLGLARIRRLCDLLSLTLKPTEAIHRAVPPNPAELMTSSAFGCVMESSSKY